jgi:uncharacterized membrane-anchored protein
MISNRKWMWPLLGVVAFIQSALLFNMIYARDRLLRSGKELILPVTLVDPRDYFRGDYVTLSYEFSRLTKPTAANDPEFLGFSPRASAFVTISPKPGGGWAVKHIGTVYPSNVAPDEVVIKGTVVSTWKNQQSAETIAMARYGIEQYFIPEGTGSDIEAKIREHKIEAIVAVAPDGTAALKGLVVDGERHEDPPLL